MAAVWAGQRHLLLSAALTLRLSPFLSLVSLLRPGPPGKALLKGAARPQREHGGEGSGKVQSGRIGVNRGRRRRLSEKTPNLTHTTKAKLAGYGRSKRR